MQNGKKKINVKHLLEQKRQNSSVRPSYKRIVVVVVVAIENVKFKNLDYVLKFVTFHRHYDAIFLYVVTSLTHSLIRFFLPLLALIDIEGAAVVA